MNHYYDRIAADRHILYGERIDQWWDTPDTFVAVYLASDNEDEATEVSVIFPHPSDCDENTNGWAPEAILYTGTDLSVTPGIRERVLGDVMPYLEDEAVAHAEAMWE